MRISFAAIAAAAALWLSGCGSSSPSSQDSADAFEEPPQLRINELLVAGVGDVANSPFEGRIEIYNAGTSAVELSRYAVRTDLVDDWPLPSVKLAAGQVLVVQSLEALGGSIVGFMRGPIRTVALVDRTGRVLDRVDIPASLWGGVLARYPNGHGPPHLYPLERASFGALNADLGFVRKLAAGTEFSQRDSSTNAIVTHDGHHWILGGWSNFGGDDWHSYTDVWKSRDGVRWSLVNTSPPYVHYSAFVAWRGRMWAIGPSSYSSEDGVDWRPEPIESPVLNRTVVFRDALVSIYGATVVATENGEHWTTLTHDAPWGADRVQPTVLVYQDKIWVMGGTGGTSELDETYHNDVWVSSDGMTWSLVNAYADWTPRLWTSGVVYDDKIFVINGSSLIEWPDEYGNTAEVWFTEDGVEWFLLESELRWPARHASFTTVDPQHGLLVLAGYGHGGIERMYNDVWSLRASVFFSKAEGDLHDLGTWGKRKDGSGESPTSFDDPDQVFVLRNRAFFEIDESWSVRGAGSRIFVGDGQRTHWVELQVSNRTRAQQPLYLLANSTTLVRGCSPSVHFKHPQAALIGGDAAPCPD
jgi:hypothetical protein